MPCLYIWLNFGSPVDVELYDQYKFGCICIAVSSVIELLAEVPVFVAQVFCFVKLRVALDTLNIFVRSVIFISLVIHDPKKAIFAFSIAQVGSTVTFVIGYYIYFMKYTANAKESKGSLKRSADNNDETKSNENDTIKNEQDDSIPFDSIKQMLPGYLHNPVRKLAVLDLADGIDFYTQRFKEHSLFLCRVPYSTRIFKLLYGVFSSKGF